ncbi:MAG TPA: hypothetical protein VF544_12405 [Pyrinomonadaceae bacterium]|jgi:hypothetical protein
MAKNQTNRLKPSVQQADADALVALRGITGYAPANAAYTIAAVTAAQEDLINAQNAELQAETAAATARDAAVEREWEFHNLILGVKKQVIAQFGDDSPEVQALGLKRKSEYKSPKRSEKSEG